MFSNRLLSIENPKNQERRNTMNKTFLTGIIAIIALALIFVASRIDVVASTGYVAAAIVLMVAYVIGQYKYGKEFR